MKTDTSNIYTRKVTIGDATLYCGNSLELLRAGVFGKIGAIVSDPPYGIGFEKGEGGLSLGGRNMEPIIGDDAPFDPRPWVDSAPVLGHNRSQQGAPLILLWGANNYMQDLPRNGTLLAWDKHLGRGGDDSFADCEWAWCGRKVKREVFRWLWNP